MKVSFLAQVLTRSAAMLGARALDEPTWEHQDPGPAGTEYRVISSIGRAVDS